MAEEVLLPLSAEWQAQRWPLRDRLKPYCATDYLRLCDASDNSRAGIVSCFKRNVASVSSRCKQAIARITEFDPARIERRRNCPPAAYVGAGERGVNGAATAWNRR